MALRSVRAVILVCAGAAVLMSAWALTACGRRAGARTDEAHGTPCRLVIASAASVRPAMKEIASRFEDSHRQVEVVCSFGSSGSLYGQILHGAPFDVFYSANAEYPRALAERGLVLAGSRRVYARGRLALWASARSGIDPADGLQTLARPSIKRVAIANPDLAPYGRAAIDAARHAGVLETITDRIVMGENAAQAAQFAVSGAADAAIVPLSLVRLPAMLEAGSYSEIPPDQHRPMQHVVVVTAATAQPDLARSFDAFVAGPVGRQILVAHGFAGGD